MAKRNPYIERVRRIRAGDDDARQHELARREWRRLTDGQRAEAILDHARARAAAEGAACAGDDPEERRRDAAAEAAERLRAVARERLLRAGVAASISGTPTRAR